MIVYEAADLIWATRIKRTADALGVPCRPVRSVQMLHDRLEDSDVRALIVDLDDPDTAFDLIREVREREAQKDRAVPRIRILAFGPHVAKELLQNARDLGADDAIPRGAFDRSLEEILLNLAARTA